MCTVATIDLHYQKQIFANPAYLDGRKFEPETIRVMGLAFEMALVALRLADRGDLASKVPARKIIDLAKACARDPERLCERVLQEFRAPPPQALLPQAPEAAQIGEQVPC